MKLCRSLLADGAPGRRGFRAPEANGSKITSAAALTGVGLGLPFTILSFSSCSPSPKPRTLLGERHRVGVGRPETGGRERLLGESRDARHGRRRRRPSAAPAQLTRVARAEVGLTGESRAGGLGSFLGRIGLSYPSGFGTHMGRPIIRSFAVRLCLSRGRRGTASRVGLLPSGPSHSFQKMKQEEA
jgi:hypothetical protein